MLLEEQLLDGKTVIEIGSGMGRTTRNLALLLSGNSGSKLIVTDITDRNFDLVRGKVSDIDLELEFKQTDAVELSGIGDESVDIIVCNFALCEINSRIGRGTLALAKFFSVLKPGGVLFMEEEFPISSASSPAQQIWAVTWRIMKSAILISGQRAPTTEYEPEVLTEICNLIGFSEVKWLASSRQHTGDWFTPRLEMLNNIMKRFPSKDLVKSFSELATDVQQRATQIGQIEVPVYELYARKG